MASEFSNICPPFVKKYFDYKDVTHVFNEFIPNLDYETRGLYFVPMRIDYSNILYIFKEDDSVKLVEKPKKTTKCFRIMKTMKPDVYELYGSKNQILNKTWYCSSSTTLLSHSILSWFQDLKILIVMSLLNVNITVLLKMGPVSLSNGRISENINIYHYYKWLVRKNTKRKIPRKYTKRSSYLHRMLKKNLIKSRKI